MTYIQTAFRQRLQRFQVLSEVDETRGRRLNGSVRITAFLVPCTGICGPSDDISNPYFTALLKEKVALRLVKLPKLVVKRGNVGQT